MPSGLPAYTMATRPLKVSKTTNSLSEVIRRENPDNNRKGSGDREKERRKNSDISRHKFEMSERHTEIQCIISNSNSILLIKVD